MQGILMIPLFPGVDKIEPTGEGFTFYCNRDFPGSKEDWARWYWAAAIARHIVWAPASAEQPQELMDLALGDLGQLPSPV